MSAHGCVGQCPQCKQGCLICHPCLPTCSRVNTWSPKTSLNNQTLEEDIQLILDRMHHKIVHNETLKIDPPHKIDKTCPYKCTRDATKTIQELFTREREKLIKELEKEAVEVLFGAQRIEAIPLSALTKFKDGK